jgi:hypothetical protein
MVAGLRIGKVTDIEANIGTGHMTSWGGAKHRQDHKHGLGWNQGGGYKHEKVTGLGRLQEIGLRSLACGSPKYGDIVLKYGGNQRNERGHTHRIGHRHSGSHRHSGGHMHSGNHRHG